MVSQFSLCSLGLSYRIESQLSLLHIDPMTVGLETRKVETDKSKAAPHSKVQVQAESGVIANDVVINQILTVVALNLDSLVAIVECTRYIFQVPKYLANV